MACPPDAMDQESRFLAALGAVRAPQAKQFRRLGV